MTTIINATSPRQAERFGETAADERGIFGDSRTCFLITVDQTYRMGRGPINAETARAMAAEWDLSLDYSFRDSGCQHATSDPYHDC